RRGVVRLVAEAGVGRVVDRLQARLVVDRRRRPGRALVDRELFAGAGAAGVVGVAAVAGLVAVAAGGQGGTGVGVADRVAVRADRAAAGRRAAGGAVVARVEAVGDGAGEAEAADLAGHRRGVVRLVAEAGVGRVVDRLQARLVVDRRRRPGRALVDRELFAGAGAAGEVGVAAVAGLVAVAAGGQGGTGVGVADRAGRADRAAAGRRAAGGAVVARVEAVGDGAGEADAAYLAGHRRGVFRLSLHDALPIFVDRLQARLVVDRRRRPGRALVDRELFAGAGAAGVVGVAAVAGLVAVAAGGQGGTGVGVADRAGRADRAAAGRRAAGGAVVARVEAVGDGAGEAEAADLAGHRRGVVRLVAEAGVGRVVDRL